MWKGVREQWDGTHRRDILQQDVFIHTDSDSISIIKVNETCISLFYRYPLLLHAFFLHATTTVDSYSSSNPALACLRTPPPIRSPPQHCIFI